MTQDFIPYEHALELKELGFDEEHFGGWFEYKGKIELVRYVGLIDDWWDSNAIDLDIKAPLYQQAFRWFREKYELYSFVFKFDEGFGYETYKEGITQTNESFDTYEEAELACLQKLLEIVKEKK